MRSRYFREIVTFRWSLLPGSLLSGDRYYREVATFGVRYFWGAELSGGHYYREVATFGGSLLSTTKICKDNWGEFRIIKLTF